MPFLKNISYLSTCRPEGGQSDIHPLRDAAVAWRGDRIAWVGPEAELPAEFQLETSFDAGGKLVVPGLVDCHTHLAFGGWRGDEFELKIQGKSYLDLAKAGGGIVSTVKKTRAETEDALVERCVGFLDEMARLGVTTVEAKSGYGLDLENELKLLKVYRRLADRHPVRVVPTFLGAHVVPAEHKADREVYVRHILEEMLPAVAEGKLARFCDVFVEDSAFSPDEARAIFAAAAKLGMRAKVHADQLGDGDGAALAAEVKAVSAEHLEYSSDNGIGKMAEAGVVAVSLPIATLYLNQPPLPARKFIAAGVPVAVATDFNPGSAPSFHLPMAMMLACTMQRMTPFETLKGATIIAAQAIGLEKETGSIEVGKRADFAVIDAPDPNHWMYHFRPNACVRTFLGGEPFDR
jgi:imidazolonepropionase